MITDARIHVLTSGQVTATDIELADRAVRRALARAAASSASATVTLSVLDDPDMPRPALARATVEDGPRRLSAQAAAPSPREAVELLESRLALRLAS